MKNAPMDEPVPERDQDPDEPSIVAGVGSSALGSVDLEDEDVEPEDRWHPDNDGETVEE